MKTSFLGLVLIPATLAVAPIPSYQHAKQNTRYVPNAYIVELSDGAISRRSSPHATVLDTISNSGIPFQTVSTYNTPEIFVGASIRLPSPADAARLAKIPGVVAVRPVIKIEGPKPIDLSVVKEAPIAHPDTYGPHVMTGVDKVHATGNFGQGIKIGIIDTGVDYKHPLLGGGIGPGFKFVGGYDFVGDAYESGLSPPMPDDDPLDECNGHGSHVAGIIGANPGNDFGFSGVAFNASLAAYRVFGCSGTTGDDIILAALIRAYNEKRDIITLSLGEPSGWTESTASVVASRIAAEGRVVTIAAGNDGEYGPWYTSSPGAGIGVISVGSVDNVVSMFQNLTVHGAVHDPITYLLPFPLNATSEYPIYVTSTDISKTDDACDSLPDNTPDLSPFVVVIHRGTCTFSQKLANIADKGGKLALIYNSDDGAFSTIDVGTFPAALISADDGKFLVQQFLTNPNLTLSFPQTGASVSITNPVGGLVSYFSTIGPTFDMYLSPEVAAPGGNILSTWPLKLGGFAIASGTSMATPFVAGAAALVLRDLGKTAKVALEMQRILQTTSVSLASSHTDGSPVRTVAQQGSGLIQVDRAINGETIVSPSQIALNDTAHFKATHTISITNSGSAKKVYELRHISAETLDTIDESGSVDPFPPFVPGAATVSLSATKLTIGPGSTKHVVATFKPPSMANATLPLYSGYIQVSSAIENFQIPYLGVVGSLKVGAILDRSANFFGLPLPVVLDSYGDPQEGPQNYTFLDYDAPFLLLRLLFGTAQFQIDLVDKNFEVPSKGKAKTIGSLVELDYIPRDSDDPFSGYTALSFSGNFANGTRIDDGQYRALLRVLKVAGDRKKEEEYEAWLSPQFGVVTPS
ncbi:Subtilisin-like protease [Mycena indigotica]|uniref:Subtilisin-like protease n=1 Tax=Mycena indigotica TaxID=2126181 RepID=A0A8H6TBU5_9AGAR|nr:Subtilisin-like protease [Mycena indigotica]KAF7315658.1 Subtilisin-like protease [Mycena indigotica]